MLGTLTVQPRPWAQSVLQLASEIDRARCIRYGTRGPSVVRCVCVLFRGGWMCFPTRTASAYCVYPLSASIQKFPEW